jgi:hypothetical protein
VRFAQATAPECAAIEAGRGRHGEPCLAVAAGEGGTPAVKGR